MPARVDAARWRDAAVIGVAIGVTFLAHVVPAVVLTGIVVAAAFTTQGVRPRTVGWLAIVAAAQVAAMSPYFVPVMLHYPGGAVHTGSSGCMGFSPSAGATGQAGGPERACRCSGVGDLAAPSRVAMGRLTAAILAAWIAVPALSCSGTTRARSPHRASARTAGGLPRLCRLNPPPPPLSPARLALPDRLRRVACGAPLAGGGGAPPGLSRRRGASPPSPPSRPSRSWSAGSCCSIVVAMSSGETPPC